MFKTIVWLFLSCLLGQNKVNGALSESDTLISVGKKRKFADTRELEKELLIHELQEKVREFKEKRCSLLNIFHDIKRAQSVSSLKRNPNYDRLFKKWQIAEEFIGAVNDTNFEDQDLTEAETIELMQLHQQADKTHGEITKELEDPDLLIEAQINFFIRNIHRCSELGIISYAIFYKKLVEQYISSQEGFFSSDKISFTQLKEKAEVLKLGLNPNYFKMLQRAENLCDEFYKKIKEFYEQFIDLEFKNLSNGLKNLFEKQQSSHISINLYRENLIKFSLEEDYMKHLTRHNDTLLDLMIDIKELRDSLINQILDYDKEKLYTENELSKLKFMESWFNASKLFS